MSYNLCNADNIEEITGLSKRRCTTWAQPLCDAMDEYEITAPLRQAAFLAQICHESMMLAFVREIWGPTEAQSRYNERADLGNTHPNAIEFAKAKGDTPGHFYMGHGPIQITGYYNTLDCSRALFDDDRLARDPALLEEPVTGSRSAGWFWKDHGLNYLADVGAFETVTRRINGGLNGYAQRLVLYERIKKGLGI